jgi:hypothetical protein
MKTPSALFIALALSAGGAAFAQQSAPAGDHPPHQHMMDRIKAADTNKDGLISKDEAAKSLPHLAEHFDEIDTNKDGFISPEELKAFGDKMHAHGGPRGPGRGGPFGGADANHDHVITRDELLQHQQQMLQDFDAADTNKDGKLSPDEMKAFREKMRAQRPPRGDAPPPASK